ncbi:MAG TPA: hypothetical protein VIW73_09190 [Candidatus Cybelea sp.]
MRSLLFAALALAATAVPAAAQPVLQLSDMARIVDLEEPAISPDGTRVALVKIDQDLRRAAYVTSLVVIGTRDGRDRVLVRGDDVAVPRWSPDGSRLLYLARPPAGGFRQLFVRSLAGAARQVTRARGEVIDAVWSPDGHTIAFVAADYQAPAAYFFAGDNDYTAMALTPSDHLWVAPAAGGPARRLTSGSWTIAPTDPGGIFSPQIAWTSDGRRITITRVENTFSGDSERSTLWQVDLSGGALRKLTDRAELELSPAYSPDGAALAYWYPLHADFNSENTLRMAANGRDVLLSERLDRNVAGSLWFPGGHRLLICAADGTQMNAWTIDVAGALRPLQLGDVHIVCDPYSSSTFDAGIAAGIAGDGSIAFVGTSATSARELYYLGAGSSAARRLTHFNDFLSRIAPARMTELTWTGPDGFAEDGVVTYPPSYALRQPQGDKFPVVLLIHGGPGLSSTRDFVWEQWPLAQMIAGL